MSGGRCRWHKSRRQSFRRCRRNRTKIGMTMMEMMMMMMEMMMGRRMKM